MILPVQVDNYGIIMTMTENNSFNILYFQHSPFPSIFTGMKHIALSLTFLVCRRNRVDLKVLCLIHLSLNYSHILALCILQKDD